MTSREREELVVRAVEGGLLDDILAAVDAADGAEGDPRDQTRETFLAFRKKIRELLGERPRQTKKMMRAVVGGIWRRKGLDWDPDTIPDEDWRRVFRSLEEK